MIWIIIVVFLVVFSVFIYRDFRRKKEIYSLFETMYAMMKRAGIVCSKAEFAEFLKEPLKIQDVKSCRTCEHRFDRKMPGPCHGCMAPERPRFANYKRSQYFPH